MTLQGVLAAMIVTAAFWLAAKTIWNALHCKKSAFTQCGDCPLNDTCKKAPNRNQAKKSEKAT